MGGCCCCCSTRRSEPIRAPTYYYCPRTSEERLPLSSHHAAPSVLSPGLVVDTNLYTSNPVTYTPPPAPIPFDVDLGHPQTPISPGFRGNNIAKNSTTEMTNAGSMVRLNPAESPENLDRDPKEIDSSFIEDDDLKKPGKPIEITSIEEEECPICLEEYTEENPKMLSKCDHHFHLCCILEWMERSDRCPVCDQEMEIDETVNG